MYTGHGFECKNGRHLWNGDKRSLIFNADTGELIKSIEICGIFLFDSDDNIILFDDEKRTLNYFNNDGISIRTVFIENLSDGYRCIINKHGGPIFCGENFIRVKRTNLTTEQSIISISW